MKNIAVVTGASSGMGREFAKTIKSNIEVDEVWLIARNEDNLKECANEVGIESKIVSIDLTDENDIKKYEDLLKKEKPNISLLINASGYGKFDKTSNIDIDDNMGMIKLNIEGLTKMCLLSIPYMKKGSNIINFASLAAFQPVPYINIYSASKAYVLSFSRSLNSEFKEDGIHVMAVCPYWTKTNFFKRAVSKNDIVKKYIVMYKSSDIINKAWRDLKKGRDKSIYGFVANGQVLLCKLLPHRLIMRMWKKQNKLK